ncbi:MAG: hypothetical protein H0X62_02135 [Bacteroidetes bacterium]|nr:hypothetical protein [Bacteroidota bacterium]
MIDFTNFRTHPDNKELIVFHYYKMDRALFVEESLQQASLEFEKFIDEAPNGRIYITVKKLNFSQVTDINDASKMKFRQPFIADAVLRYFVLSLFLLMMGLAITGMIVTSFKN